VASDILPVSGRHLLAAMIPGQRDPKVLAQLARASMPANLGQLQEALTGHLDDHHGFTCRMLLERIDELTSRIEELTARIDQQVAPFAAQVAQLDAVPGIGLACAQELIAELGVDMAVFPTAAQLVAWPSSLPSQHLSRQAKTAATGNGNPWLAATLGEIAVTAGRTNTFLGERYRRIAKRRRTQRALVAVGNSVLTIVWHLLADPNAWSCDLGPDFYQSPSSRHRQEHNLIRQLQQLTGKTVTLTPRPATPAA